MGLEHLQFEVTETGIMEQPNRASNTLMEIRNRGSRIAVDDFGTGHSSLAYLADLPIDTIKIDKFFVQNLVHPWGEAIVGAAATLAQKLGLTTIAEGIETEEQYERCREIGVTQGQGFHIGRPMFRDELHEWLGM
jgi:EAL domain-containing protein (putative c-di-GMP-specific phosphodiesterase class I)